MVDKVEVKDGVVYIADDIKIEEDTIYVDGFPTITMERLRTTGRRMKEMFELRERNTELRKKLRKRGVVTGE